MSNVYDISTGKPLDTRERRLAELKASIPARRLASHLRIPPNRRELLDGFAREAGAAAGRTADKRSTAERAWLGVEPRVDSLPGVGPATLRRMRYVFSLAYESARLDAFSGQGTQS